MTDPDITKAQSLIQNAYQAISLKDFKKARNLAEIACKLAPDLEDPYLILAALSTPASSIKYLNQALAVNPASERARQGMHWAIKKQRTGLSSSAPDILASSVEHTSPVKIKSNQVAASTALPLSLSNQKKRNGQGKLTPWIIGVLAVCIGIMIWSVFPSIQSALANSNGNLLTLAFLYTPTSTPTVTNTPIPTSTPTSTTTNTPLPTLTSTATNTLTATVTSTNTATSTATKAPTATRTEPPPPTSTAKPKPTAVPTKKPTTPVIVKTQPPPGVGESEHWIDISLKKQRAYAYEGQTLVKTFIVSTGTWLHPTVKGQFHIYVRYRYANMSGPGYFLKDVPYVMYFYQSYGLHGTYWHNNFGTPMSHGCVNFSIPDAGWVYNWTTLGTLVSIHD